MKKNLKKLNAFDSKFNAVNDKGAVALKELTKFKDEFYSSKNNLDSLKEFWLSEMAQIKKQSNEIKEIKPEFKKLAHDIQASTDQLTQEKLNGFEKLSKELIRNFEKNFEDNKQSSLQQLQKIEEMIHRVENSSSKMIGDYERSTSEIMTKYQEELEKTRIFFSSEAKGKISSARRLGFISLVISLIVTSTLFVFLYIGKQAFPDKWKRIYSMSFNGSGVQSESSKSSTPRNSLQ